MNERKRKSSELKKIAREAMAGRYGVLVGSTLINLLISFICSFFPSLIFPATTVFNTVMQYILVFLLSLLVSLIGAGYTRIALSCLRGEQPYVGDLLHAFFHHPDRYLCMYLIPTAVSMLFSLPGTLAAPYLSERSMMSPGGTVNINGTTTYLFYTLLISMVLSVITFLVLIPLSMATYLLLDYPDLGPIQALRESMRLMRRNKLRYIYVSLSFFGMYVLAYCSCGIGYLWVLPYQEVTFSAFYMDLTGELDDRLQGTPVEFEV